MELGKKQILSVIAFLLMVINAATLIYTSFLNGFEPVTIAECAVELALSVTAFIYVLSGFSKRFAANYKAYFILCAASYIIDYVFFAFDTEASRDYTHIMIGVAIEFICFGAYVLLAFAPDFGKKRSLIAAYTPLILYILCAGYYAFSYYSGGTSESFLYLVSEYAGYIPACLVDVIVVYGKYNDKALRGRPMNK